MITIRYRFSLGTIGWPNGWHFCNWIKTTDFALYPDGQLDNGTALQLVRTGVLVALIRIASSDSLLFTRIDHFLYPFLFALEPVFYREENPLYPGEDKYPSYPRYSYWYMLLLGLYSRLSNYQSLTKRQLLRSLGRKGRNMVEYFWADHPPFSIQLPLMLATPR